MIDNACFKKAYVHEVRGMRYFDSCIISIIFQSIRKTDTSNYRPAEIAFNGEHRDWIWITMLHD